MKSKKEIHGILEPGDDDSKYFDPFIISLVLINIAIIILQSVDKINQQYGIYLFAIEVFTIIVFTIEYVLRVWSCDIDKRYCGTRGRIKYMITPMALIDLMAVLPFYLMFLPDLRFLRTFRIFRIFRVLKLARYSEKVMKFGNVLYDKKEELILSTFIVIVIMMVSSTMMYEAEHEAQPDKFGSIPDAMWWGIVTLATVGYGDVFPITPLGKLIGAIVIICGIALCALPAGILASGFSEAHAREAKICPHCGRQL